MFEGWQDGCLRLPDPIMHRRRIVLDKTARRVVIEDTLRMAGAHDIELFFHCSECCRIEATADGYTLTQEGRTLSLQLPRGGGASAQVFCGKITPILGWVSRRFNEKQPAATIWWRARLAGETVLRSEIMGDPIGLLPILRSHHGRQ